MNPGVTAAGFSYQWCHLIKREIERHNKAFATERKKRAPAEKRRSLQYQ
jgi:hypothetical protein